MSNLRLALAYLRHRALVTVLTVISIALGLGLAVTVLALSRQTKSALGNETAYADLVIGGKGGPLQLVLNSLYYLDAPTGNISISLWHRLEKDPSVSSLIPLNMGDNYFGAPIIGTVPAFFEGRQPRTGGNLVASGRLFNAPFEVTVGADVASRHHMVLGQQIIGAHGWGKSNDFHTQFPYKIVGILAPTGSSMDRVVYTDYHSVWIVHAHPDADEKPEPGARPHDPSQEITALLVRFSQPARRFALEREINAEEAAMAVDPASEINRLVTVFVAPLQGLLLVVAYLVVFVAALTILISLYLTIHQRRRDVAITRALGATRGDVFRQITVEAAALAGLGVVCGWLLGHVLIALSAPFLMSRFGLYPNPWSVAPTEVLVAASVCALGMAAGLLPAAVAYRLPVADTLMRE